MIVLPPSYGERQRGHLEARRLFPCVEGTRTLAQPWLVVFDLDGTLIDSSRDLWTSVNAALAHVGRAALLPQVVTGFIGDGAPMLVRRALAATEPREAVALSTSQRETVFRTAYAAFLDFYRAHKLDTTACYAGVKESLNMLRSRYPELRMAVLTNKPVQPSREICVALGIDSFFFANYGGNSFATKKPHPDGLLTIMKEARQSWRMRGRSDDSLPARGAVMVGDSEADMQVARACGVQSLGCSYGLAPEALAGCAPDITVASPWEWPEVLGL